MKTKKLVNKITGENIKSAFNPAACVFVSANAGAGKTSLLTNRVLSLLLHGAHPANILCLTFTNAAAAEMSNRILKELGSWVMADDKTLYHSVSKLTDGMPGEHLLIRARRLFAEVLEAPDGVRIQTIHGFCQSLLRRFPLEAGVSPHFTVMDNRSEQEALAEARLRIFSHAGAHSPKLQAALDALARSVSEHAFHALLDEIVKKKRRFRGVFSVHGGPDIAARTIYARCGVSPSDTAATIYTQHFAYADEQLHALRDIAQILSPSENDKERATADALANWLSSPDTRRAQLDAYTLAFLTQKGEPRKTLFLKNTITDKALIDALHAEQARVYHYSLHLRALATANHSVQVLHIAEALLSEYDAIKTAHGWLDYDDLILTSRDLLSRAGMSPWVLYKLDGGIDHILVDEAQDTSPEQWHIIDALTQEFFAGRGAKDTDRSLFIVGDEKQSIYSFQGADVEALGHMQRHFAEQISNAGKTAHALTLAKSYRSTDEVLTAVDAIFAKPEARAGLTFDGGAFTHIATRGGQPGLVEVWPLVQADDSGVSHSTQLARKLADAISVWIAKGEMTAGDIMVLVRTRTSFVDKFVRALKRKHIPVAGHDRMLLGDNLAVQDLIALGQVLLLPEDDLTLASLLKSPIFNISEEALFQLAHGRGEQHLWQRLTSLAYEGKEPFSGAYMLLAELRARADFTPPFELYSNLLDTHGARARFLGRMGNEYADPIDEFLNQALLYERSHAPSLQGFLHWLTHSDSEIKRDMEQAKDAVRIMTVHGAKGLQAKTVILPDTVELPKAHDSIFWLEEGVPVRPLASEQDDALCKRLRAERTQTGLAEYRRLLYVALTRAEDRLYICGSSSKDSINGQSWYQLIKTGLADVATTLSDGTLRIGDDRRPMADNKHPTPPVTRHPSADFAFLMHNPPAEPSPTQPLTPSRLSGEAPANASPLSEKTSYAAGRYIHSLLEHLPALATDTRKAAAGRLAVKYRAELSDAELEKATRDALAIIENPEWAFMFGEGALAEVPVAGLVEAGGKPIAVSGQIDRLYIGESDVWIIDFKSNQLAPVQVPTPYIRQLALYRLLLQRIYPEKHIHAALLWTAAAKLDVLPHALLDEWHAAT